MKSPKFILDVRSSPTEANGDDNSNETAQATQSPETDWYQTARVIFFFFLKNMFQTIPTTQLDVHFLCSMKVIVIRILVLFICRTMKPAKVFQSTLFVVKKYYVHQRF
eukprot:GHVL01031585.1.p2 GENE.GHVL01031585.1~~GHVL01031585.1.p2  ORF type:complete len:108 (+),score=4.23 GHVL01031585.1:289-612(+)